jgi:L-asparaginase II
MNQTPYEPIFELTRGGIVECIHDGAVAVSDPTGRLIAWYGDPDAVTFLRSSAKPFQALPFYENGGQEYYGLSQREMAVTCASHTGTDEHVQVVSGIQARTGVGEADLLCGTHPPSDEPTFLALIRSNAAPTPNRHNCSGKHTGMLSAIRMLAARDGLETNGLDYIDPRHPYQQQILAAFAELCGLAVEQVVVGVDGCSAPNFAVPLRNAALGFARLTDPGGVQPARRADALGRIAAAMMAHPDMVGGPDSFDTALMRVAGGKIVCKGGAEGYQAVGVLPGAIRPGSPALGIALKISDGDAREKARSAVVLETLHQLGALDPQELEALSRFGPRFPIYNWRKVEVGQARPAFQLKFSQKV